MRKEDSINIIAVIQARMGSTRMPGKPLMSISGKTMLGIIIDRLTQSREVDSICIATTDSPKDDELAEYLDTNNILYSRGPEYDIIGRLLGAAIKFKADIIVRVWGDCPLIDAEVIDRMIEECLKHESVYVTNSNPPTFPFGINAEIYSRDIIERIVSCTNDSFYREFPFEYIKSDKQINILNVEYKKDASGINLTVDYPQDVKVIETILEHFLSSGRDANIDNIVEFCEKNKHIFEISKGLPRNIEYKEYLKSKSLSK
jgi:spore coat polysaccharide biosynthesis protein SpsF (cytidylyltransferase family)